MTGYRLYNDELELNDLLQRAHPSGGWVAAEVESGEGLVEDTIQAQIKGLQVAYRPPTGQHRVVVRALYEQLATLEPKLAKRLLVLAEDAAPAAAAPAMDPARKARRDELAKKQLAEYAQLVEQFASGEKKDKYRLSAIQGYARGQNDNTATPYVAKVPPQKHRDFLLGIVNDHNNDEQLRGQALGYAMELYPQDPAVKKAVQLQKGGELDGAIKDSEALQNSGVTVAQLNRELKENGRAALAVIQDFQNTLDESSDKAKEESWFSRGAGSLGDELDWIKTFLNEMSVDGLLHQEKDPATFRSVARELKKYQDSGKFPALAPGANAIARICVALSGMVRQHLGTGAGGFRNIIAGSKEIGSAAKVQAGGEEPTGEAEQVAKPGEAPPPTTTTEPVKGGGEGGKAAPKPTKTPTTNTTTPGDASKLKKGDPIPIRVITFTSPITNQLIDDFAIAFVIKNAIEEPRYLYSALKMQEAIPNNWSENDFFGDGATQERDQLFAAMKTGFKTSVTEQVKRKGGDDAKVQETIEDLKDIFLWLPIIVTKAKKLGGSKIGALAWLEQKFPDQMRRIETSRDAVDTLLKLLIGEKFVNKQNEIDEVRADAERHGRVATIVDSVEQNHGLRNAKGPKADLSGIGEREEDETTQTDRYKFWAEKNKLSEAERQAYLPGSLNFYQQSILNMYETPSPSMRNIYPEFYRATKIWDPLPPEVKERWLDKQRSSKTQQSALSMTEQDKAPGTSGQVAAPINEQRAETSPAVKRPDEESTPKEPAAAQRPKLDPAKEKAFQAAAAELVPLYSTGPITLIEDLEGEKHLVQNTLSLYVGNAASGDYPSAAFAGPLEKLLANMAVLLKLQRQSMSKSIDPKGEAELFARNQQIYQKLTALLQLSKGGTNG